MGMMMLPARRSLSLPFKPDLLRFWVDGWFSWSPGSLVQSFGS